MADETVGLLLDFGDSEAQANRTAEAVGRAEAAVIGLATASHQLDTVSISGGLAGGLENASAKTVAYASALQRAGKAGKEAGGDLSHMAYFMLMVSQTADDAQYGLRSVVNNVGPLALSFGQMVGLYNPVSMAFAGIAQVGLVVANNWEKVKDVFGWFQEFAGGGSVPKLADDLNKLAAPGIKIASDKEVAKQIEAYQKGATGPDEAGQHEGSAAAKAAKEMGGQLYRDTYRGLLGSMSEQQAQSTFSNGVSVAAMNQARTADLIDKAKGGDAAAIAELERLSPGFRDRMFAGRDAYQAEEKERERKNIRSQNPMPDLGLIPDLTEEDKKALKEEYERVIETIRLWGRTSEQTAEAIRGFNEIIVAAQKRAQEDRDWEDEQAEFEASNERAAKFRKSPKYAWQGALAAARKAGINEDIGSTAEVDRLLKSAPGGDSTLLSEADQAYIRRRADRLRAMAQYNTAGREMQQAYWDYATAGNPAAKRWVASMQARESRMTRNSRMAQLGMKQQAIRDAGGKGAIAERQKAMEKMERASSKFESAVEKLMKGDIKIIL